MFGMAFRDRVDAGQQLAAKLQAYANRQDVLVLALPRGGVPVAAAVAERLGAPLDVFVVRKLGVPGNEELAMGAIATGGVRVLNPEVVDELGISEALIRGAEARERRELERREREYRGGRPAPEVRGRVVILVDDGLATGATMLAAARALRQQLPARIVVAVPVAPRRPRADLLHEVDDLVCLLTPEPFYAIGMWYVSFPQTTDQEVRGWLERAARRVAATAPSS
jgi:putative phosphoribosyl transferase